MRPLPPLVQHPYGDSCKESTPSFILYTARVHLDGSATPHDTTDCPSRICILFLVVPSELDNKRKSWFDQRSQRNHLVKHKRCVVSSKFLTFPLLTVRCPRPGFFTLIIGRIFHVDYFTFAKIGAVATRCVL